MKKGGEEPKSSADSYNRSRSQTSYGIGSGTLLLLVPQGLSLLANYAIQLFLIWSFVPSEYGAFFVVISLSTVLSFLLNTGIPQAVSKMSSANPNHARSALLAGMKGGLLIATGISLVGIIAAGLLALWLGDISIAPIIQVSMLILLPNATHGIIVGFFNGLRRFKNQSAILSSQLVFRVILVFLLVLIGGTIFHAVLGYVIASLLAGVIAILMLGDYPNGSREIKASRILSLALPMTIVYFVFNLVLNLDVFLLNASSLVDVNLVGYYSGAAIIARAPYFLVAALSGTIFPAVSALDGLNDREGIQGIIREWFGRTLIILLPILPVFSILSSDVIDTIFPPSYTAASPSLAILILGMGAFSLFTWTVTILLASGQYNRSIAIVLGVLGLDAILNLVLIPALSIVGAALATLISSIMGFAIPAVVLQRSYGPYYNMRTIVRVITVSLILGLLTLTAKALELPLLLIGLVVILSYLASFHVMGLFKLLGLSEVRRWLFKKQSLASHHD